MPRIDDQILECVVYFYPSQRDAEEGLQIGGSGFCVSVVPESKLGAFTYLVTNKHIIRSGHTVVRYNLKNGGKSYFETDEEHWITHPDGDDLAILPITRSDRQEAWKHIPSYAFLTREHIEKAAIGPGDDVFSVGRFINHDGRQKNLPTVRFGHIAQMPWEPIRIDGFERVPFDRWI